MRLGRQPGIYATWDEAKAQVHRFPAAEHQKFAEFTDALKYIQLKHAVSWSVSMQKNLPLLVKPPEQVPEKPSTNDRNSNPSEDEHMQEVEDPAACDADNAAVDTLAQSLSQQLSSVLPEQSHVASPAKADTESQVFYLFADGGSRGNPGVAGAGFVLYDSSGNKVAKGAIPLRSPMTNNEAEYHALLHGLKAAKEKGVKRLKVLMDSKLVVKQCQRVWHISSANLVPLNAQAMREIGAFEEVEMQHIPREGNSEADALANRAMDSRLPSA